MSKRINVILPDETMQILKRVTLPGTRSRFIARAVTHYVRTRSAANLRERLKEGYLANARLNLELAQEWFPLEEEACRAGRRKTRG